MIEEWLPVVGFECSYEISNQGRLRSIDRHIVRNNRRTLLKGRLLKLSKDKDGYLIASLWKNNKGFNVKIHRLVAEHFVKKERSDANQVNHKDLNKENACSENLEWCTNRENAFHSLENSSKKRGAYLDKRFNYFYCVLKNKEGRLFRFGKFECKELAYKEYYKQYFKEYGSPPWREKQEENL